MPFVLFKQGFSKMDYLKIIDTIKEKNSMKVSSIKIPTLIIYWEKIVLIKNLHLNYQEI